jgi:hypothetical protein
MSSFQPAAALVVSDSSHSQVRLSPQARVFLSEQCIATNVPQLELLNWCRTRWSSADTMIERILQLRPVCANNDPSSLLGVEEHQLFVPGCSTLHLSCGWQQRQCPQTLERWCEGSSRSRMHNGGVRCV